MIKSSRKIFGVPVSRHAGVTLTELMIAVSVLTIGVISSMGAFKYINKAMLQSRIKTIATNLAQEKMEVLRNKPYFQLLVTTATAVSTGYSPNFTYDTGNYQPETITLWGLPALIRVVNVDYISLSGSVATALPYNSNDTGMKRITVIVSWTDASGIKQKVRLDSYFENPTAAVLSAGFTGTVSNISGGAAVGDALVQVQGSPKWRGYSDPATGVYRFQVAPGTYTLVCSTQGYFPDTSSTLYVAAGAYTTKNFSINKIATGTISGMVYIRDHLVISQVVVETNTWVNAALGNRDVEYLELFNPTTAPINIGVTGDPKVRIDYDAEAAGQDRAHDAFNFVFLSTYVPSGSYYLLANATSFMINGSMINADACFSDNPNCATAPNFPGYFDKERASAIRLRRYSDNAIYDIVGWDDNNNNACTDTGFCEGTSIPNYTAGSFDGMGKGNQIVRTSAYSVASAVYGKAYDSNNNSVDFIYPSATFTGISYPPKNSASAQAVISGTPAAGAIVSVNDGLSASALVSSTGYFLVTNVATSAVLNTSSSWEVMATSYTIFNSSAGLVIAAGQNKDVGTIVLSTAISGGVAFGYVYGSGVDQNRPLPSIRAGSGGNTVLTNSQGYYRLFLGTGTAAVTANVGLENGSYQSADEVVTLTEGSVTAVPDFHLAQGGTISGYVTSGTGALPDIIVQATNGGAIYEDTSDSTGNYYISATTSAVAYTVMPVLDALQSYTSLPTDPLTVTLSAPCSTVFAGTITVVGAMGTIAGTVVASTVSVTTGILVVASTIAVTNPLITFTAANLLALPVYYSASSQADGTYSLDVRSSTSMPYYLMAFYPVVNPTSGAVTYTSREFSSVWVSSAGATTTRNFVW